MVFCFDFHNRIKEMNRKGPGTYRYKHLELALAQVFKVEMKDLPAFRARIRHLRNLGVPPVGKPGSGQTVTYTRADAIRLLIALESELFGLPPKFAAAFSNSFMQSELKNVEAAIRDGKRLFLSADPSFAFDINHSWILVARPDLVPMEKSTHRRIAINIATSISLLDSALRRATGESNDRVSLLAPPARS